MNKYYELFSLAFGFAAILVITFFLIFNYNYCFILLEPNFWIKVPEILIGIFITPYYIIKIKQRIHQEKLSK